MPHKGWEIRIYDIIDAIENIRRYTEGLRFEDFAADPKTMDAVVRNIIVIGEAASRVPEDVCLNHPEIPWYEMRGMRNFVIHEYFKVSARILWDTIMVDLPPLTKILQKFFSDESQH